MNTLKLLGIILCLPVTLAVLLAAALLVFAVNGALAVKQTLWPDRMA